MYPQAVITGSRANRAGTATVLLEPLGQTRFENFSILDFRVDRQFEFGTTRIIPSLDVFNATNGNSVLARRRVQNAANANTVSGIVAPRVIRFGVRVTF